MNLPAVTLPDPAIVEGVLIRGDLAALNTQQRVEYVLKVCETVGLNPLTQPFEYITFQGKLALYARKNCAEQLRAIHNISVEDVTSKIDADTYIVTTKVKLANGRTDASIGAVAIGNLRGEARANAMMKCETKSKRRATLSICGLGFLLDESELPDEVFQRLPAPPAANVIRSPSAAATDNSRETPPAPPTLAGEPAPPPDGDTQAGGAGTFDESQVILTYDQKLADAAETGARDKLQEAYEAVPERHRLALRAALERRHWPRCLAVEAANAG